MVISILLPAVHSGSTPPTPPDAIRFPVAQKFGLEAARQENEFELNQDGRRVSQWGCDLEAIYERQGDDIESPGWRIFAPIA